MTVTALHTVNGNLALFAIDDVTDLTSRIENYRKLRDVALLEVEERKKAETSLTLANKKLNLLSSITRHDILNQLTVLLGYMDITREMVNDPQTLEYLIIQENAAQNIRRQIEFTRDYEDLGVQAPRWHKVTPVLRVAAGSLPLGDVALVDTTGDLEIYADPLFEKVFYNLIDNSLRYGEAITEIKVHYAEEPGGLVLVFEDNGVGIPGDLKKKIFNRGFGKNTGLGLFLIREILEITGISLEENGETGKGARFAIHVPPGVYRFGKPKKE